MITIRARVLLYAVGFVALTSGSLRGSSDGDHLLPPNIKLFSRYLELLSSKLGVTGFEYGRAIVMPSFEPEYSVSVYSRSKDDQRSCWVTYIVLERNLGQLTDTGRYPEKAAPVKITRTDAKIPKPLAELVGQAWRLMLVGDQHPRPTPPPEREIIAVDGTVAEFAIERAKGRPLRGELDGTLNLLGKKTEGLVSLANLLVLYCKAEPGERERVAQRIEHTGAELLLLLKPVEAASSPKAAITPEDKS